MREVGWKRKYMLSEENKIQRGRTWWWLQGNREVYKGSNYLWSADLPCSGEVVSYKCCLSDEHTKACATPSCVTMLWNTELKLFRPFLISWWLWGIMQVLTNQQMTDFGDIWGTSCGCFFLTLLSSFCISIHKNTVLFRLANLCQICWNRFYVQKF